MVPLTIELDRDFAETHGVSPLVYKSPNLNGPHACRPLRLAAERETNASTLREKDRLLREVALAGASLYVPPDYPDVRVTFVGLLTMHDQKTTSTMCGMTNMSKCPLCHAGPKDFMADNTSKFEVKVTYINLYEKIKTIHSMID